MTSLLRSLAALALVFALAACGGSDEVDSGSSPTTTTEETTDSPTGDATDDPDAITGDVTVVSGTVAVEGDATGIVHIAVRDLSISDPVASLVAETTIDLDAGEDSFTVAIDRTDLDSMRRYTTRAVIEDDAGETVFTTNSNYLVDLKLDEVELGELVLVSAN